MKKINKLLVLGLMASFGFMILGCSESPKEKSTPRPVRSVVIGAVTDFNSRSFPGRAKAVQEVNLSFNIKGTLIELPIQIGDLVSTGQVIAKLDAREFEAKLKSAQAESKRDEQNFARAKTLITKGNISQVDYDILQAKLVVSQANVDLAEKTLADTVIKAPFNGRIASLPVKNFQNVAANQMIARLLDSSIIEMVVQIPEHLISAVPFVKDIKVQFDAFPTYKIDATIKEISNEASTDTRTYPVTLTMKQPKGVEILPGMAGKVTGHVLYPDKALENLIRIPESAIFSQTADKNAYVWVIDEKTHKVKKQQISLGELTSTGIAVNKGLKIGDRIVIAGIHSLQEGEEVALLNQ